MVPQLSGAQLHDAVGAVQQIGVRVELSSLAQDVACGQGDDAPDVRGVQVL